jgi:predicted RNase H-like HicB family nuclease/DNA-binding XRE family transcriptional regulator
MYYVAHVHQEGQQLLVEFPDAPGCQTFVDSPQELHAAAQEALEGWLEAHLVDGEAPPRPKLRHKAPEGRRAMKIGVAPSLSAALSIRWARQDLDLSQADLARRLGVSQQQIAALEDPDKNPTLRSLDEVAKGLGLRLDVTFVE